VVGADSPASKLRYSDHDLARAESRGKETEKVEARQQEIETQTKGEEIVKRTLDTQVIALDTSWLR
jgi:hypothetical protein